MRMNEEKERESKMGGLTNNEAKLILLEELQSTCKRHTSFLSWCKMRQKKFLFDAIRVSMLLLASLLLLISFFVPFVFTTQYYEWHLLAESLIVFTIVLASSILFFHIQRNNELGLLLKFEEHLKQFQGRSGLVFHDTAEHMHVLRDSTWMNISTNLLVVGDVILLESEHPMPCRVRVSSTDEILERGEVFKEENQSLSEDISRERIYVNVPHQQSKNVTGYFGVLEETPATLQLEEMLQYSNEGQKVENPLTGENVSMTLPMATWKTRVYKKSFMILIVSLIISFIINSVKFALQIDQQQWTELLLVRQAYLCLPLLFLTSRWTIHILHSIGNAIVLTVFHKLQVGDQFVAQTEGEFFDDEENERNDRAIKITSKLPLWILTKYFYHLVMFHNNTITIPQSLSGSVYRPSLLELVGSITVVCVIDRGGILSDNVDYTEKVCFFENSELTILELSRERNEMHSTTSSHRLEVSNASCQYSLQFNDPDWEHSISSLKPLGLNCLLNSFCKFGEYNSSFDRASLGMLHSDQHMQWLGSSCNCLLGIRIGFSEGAVDAFFPLKHIYRIGDCTDFLNSFQKEKSEDEEKESQLKERASKYGYRYFDNQKDDSKRDNISGYSISTAVQETASGSLQLLSKGSLALIIASSRQAWDGNQLHEITHEDVDKILELEKQWAAYQCVAFSYQPFSEDYFHLLSDTTPKKVETSTPLQESEDSVDFLKGNSSEFGRPSFDSLRSNVKRSSTSSIPRIVEEGIDETREWQEVMELEPIFIGMIAMRKIPRYDAEDFIIGLKNSGTRFVHFSKENQRATKAFSERLGLETDWNCAIDLQDSGDKVENTPSGLPKGISNIRDHLDQIDDVPLLIPSFYNCDEAATLEMIKIFQEKGDIVCCIGSTTKFENYPIYLQSDLSVGWQPQGYDCLNHEEEHSTNLSSSHFMTDYSTGSFSVDLNCLCCELIAHKDSSLDYITALIQTSRHYLINFKQAVSFFLGCSLFIHCILFLNFISFLPTIFNGIHIIWLLCFICPILSFSLMSSHKGKDTMKNMNNKRYQFLNQSFNRAARTFAIVIIPISFLLVLFFACSLALAWGSNGSVAGLFGFASRSQLRSKEYFEALIIAQNSTLTCFVLCLVAWSFTYLQQYHSVRRHFRRYLNLKWLLMASIVLFCQIVFMCLMINVAFARFLMWNLFLFPVAFFFIVILLLLEFYMKHLYRKWFEQEQKFMALEFNTKLGMYSPVSPF